MNRCVLAWVAIVSVAASNGYHIDVSIPNAQSYHDQEEPGNEFKYGYEVKNVNNQFQHKQKGPDDVTYGCYGHIDPTGGHQLTFFVADRLGYRRVLTDQPVTVYPVTAATSDVSGLSGGQLIQWSSLPFPAACRQVGGAELSASSSSQRASVSSQPRPYDETDTAESRDAFQRTVLADGSRNPAANELAVSTHPAPFDNYQRPSVAYHQTDADRARGPEPWQLDSSSSSNNNGVINSHSAATEAANQPRPSDKGQQGAGAGSSPSSTSWRPFLGEDNSFLLSSQCEKSGGRPEQTLTLYIPFRVACSDMQEFEAEVAKLAAKFNHGQC